MARTTPDKVELKRNIANIKKFLQREDCGMIDSGIELARSLDQESIFEEFLKDCKIYEGSLVRNKIFSGEASAQQYLDYALLNLIAYAPEKTNLNKSLKRSNIKSLNFYENEEWTELPSCISSFTSLTSLDMCRYYTLENIDGLAKLTNLTSLDLSDCDVLENIDGLTNLTKLTSLNLQWCNVLQNVDGLTNLTKLTNLDLGRCDALQNIDGLAKLTNLTNLGLWGCDALQNVDGLANLTKLTNLDLSKCKSLMPKPSPVFMNTRQQVVAYQERIKKSMKK